MSFKNRKKYKFRFDNNSVDPFDPLKMVNFTYENASFKSNKGEVILKRHYKHKRSILLLNPSTTKVFVYCGYGIEPKRISKTEIALFEFDPLIRGLKKEKDKDLVMMIQGKIDGEKIYTTNGTLSQTPIENVSNNSVKIEEEADENEVLKDSGSTEVLNTEEVPNGNLDSLEEVKDAEIDDVSNIEIESELESEETETKTEVSVEDIESIEELKELIEQELEKDESEGQGTEIIDIPLKSEKTNIDLCTNCGKELNNPNFDFCGFCGEKIERIEKCSECGKTRENINFSFCSYCGAKFNN